jgi:hypothetical protein
MMSNLKITILHIFPMSDLNTLQISDVVYLAEITYSYSSTAETQRFSKIKKGQLLT